jgi:hypothetical protein
MTNVVISPPKSISVRVGTGVLTGTQQVQINQATNLSNTAITEANTAYILANSVSGTANTAELIAINAGNTANSAYILANNVSSTANTAEVIAINAGNTANSAYSLANSVSGTANASQVIAISAYNAANTKFSANGGIINGNILPSNGNISLGSAAAPFKEVYVSSGTVWIDNIALSNTNNQFTISNETAMNVSGNIITSGKFFGIIDAGDNSF